MIKHNNLLIVLLTFTLYRVSFAQQPVPYGDNAKAGKYIQLNGVKHYYETYGEGKPLLLIHGNSTGIKGWAAQIEYFSQTYKVYAIDCRGRGKSDLGTDTLSYIQQAKDMAAFIDLMKMDSVDVIGKSDGGIIALLLGIYYPAHLHKLVSFSANCTPDTSALYPFVTDEIRKEREHADKMLAQKDATQNWYLIQQRNRMMEFQPRITADDLHKIAVPVLVISTDRDMIKEEHTFFIYRNIPLAHLSIVSGETHHLARKNPVLFNTTVMKFLSEPYRPESYRH